MDSLNKLDTMASQLLEKMPEILEKGQEYGGDLFNRFVQYAIFLESLTIFMCLCFFIFGVIVILKNKTEEYCDDSLYIYNFIGYVIAIVSFIFLLLNITDLIKIIVLPELYILNIFQK